MELVNRDADRPRMGITRSGLEQAVHRIARSPYWPQFAQQARAALFSRWSGETDVAAAIGEGALLSLVEPAATTTACVHRAIEHAARLLDRGAWSVPDDLTHAQQLAAMAFGYDWVHPTLPPALRRIGAEILVELAQRSFAHFPVHLEQERLDAFNNHAFWNQAGVGAAAFAALGEHPGAEALARASVETFATRLLPALERTVGSEGTWNEGTHYTQVVGRSAFVWMEAARGMLSRDPFAASWVRSIAYHWLYLTLPDGSMTILGDWFTDRLPSTIQQLMMRSGQVIARAAAAHRDPYLQWFASWQSRWIRRDRIPLWLVLWFDPDVAARPLSELPRARLFRPRRPGPGAKLAVLRSDWGPRPRVITLSMGDWLSHHAHNDANAFSIHHREPLAIDPGFGGDTERCAPLIELAEKVRDKVSARRAGSPGERAAAPSSGGASAPRGPHQTARAIARRLFRAQEELSWRFYRRTSAHNSLLVPVEREQAERDEPLLRERGWGYDGGQRVPLVRGRPRTLEGYLAVRNPEYPDSSLFETGSCVAFESHDRYDYVVGDAAKAYHRSQLTRFLRHLLFLKPEVLVVFDAVTTPPGREPVWLLQTVERPRVVDGVLRATHGEGALDVVALLPVGGRRKVIRVPGMAVYGKSGTGRPHHRTEVHAPPGDEHRFLHVVHIGESRRAPCVRAVSRRDGETLHLHVQLEESYWHVRFRADGEPHVSVA